jgi:hypothetical protein
MNLNDFYVLVDNEKKLIIDKVQELPENWNNISGLKYLPDKKIKCLDWSGNKNLGWINIKSNDIKKYSSSKETLELNKNHFKNLVSKIRKEKQSEHIRYDNAQIKTDLKTRHSLLFLINSNLENDINFKCLNGYFSFNLDQLKDILNKINNHTQKYFDIEKNIFDQIDKCDSVQDFVNINYDF